MERSEGLALLDRARAEGWTVVEEAKGLRASLERLEWLAFLREMVERWGMPPWEERSRDQYLRWITQEEQLSWSQTLPLPEVLERAGAEGWIALDLAGRNLDQVPPEVWGLTQLEVLIFGKWDSKAEEVKGNNLTTLPPEIGQLTSLTHLDLWSNQLSSLPSEIVQLTSLTHLDLDSNQLSSLPPEIGQLTSLTHLDLRSNQLSSLPSEIGQLTSLTHLYLCSNQLSSLPSEIIQLTSLTHLDFHSNQLSSLPPEIVQLTSLTNLYLSSNQLSSLPPEIGQLTSLTNLNLSFNQLSSLPPEIGQLTSLTNLNLSSNQLSSLPPEIVQLTALTQLDLWSNQLSSLPPEIGQLTSLTRLDLFKNQLSSLPPEIGQLTSLTQLALSDNRFESLPPVLRQLPKLQKLHLLGNPIPLPPEILGSRWGHEEPGDLQTIFEVYFTPPEDSEALFETKLLIVGDPGAGKTSLANKLKDADYRLQPEEKSTEGIDILPWEINHTSDNKLRVKIWDFGGQQIYHSTHQFFLTERSVYVLVADTRKENTDFYYWLKAVEVLSNGSPVIIVKNEKQNRQCDLDERRLRFEFGNLKEILAVNLADNRGLTDLQTKLQHQLCTLDHIGSRVPRPWANIRAVLQNLSGNTNYITQDRYFQLCRQNGFEAERDMLIASKFLHDLGICLHFQQVKGLRKVLILRPIWATSTIYKILDDPAIKKDFGRFTEDDLRKIWDKGDAAKMRDELLDLMMEFGLCYESPHCKGRYISPQLLEKESLEYGWDETDNLILRYEYTFKPKDIFPRFVVATHELIENQCQVWRHGVVLTDGYARAEIIEMDRYYDADITIRVTGSNKRDLLTHIARQLETISDTYDRIEYERHIPCNCTVCKPSQTPHTYTWDNLQRRLQNRIYEVQCDISYEQVNVQSLINDIATPRPFDPREKEFMETGIGMGDRPRKPSPFGPDYPGNNIHFHVSQTTSQDRSMATHITQTHNGNGDNIAGDKTVTNNTQPSNAPKYSFPKADKVTIVETNSGTVINEQNNHQPPAEAAKEIQALLAQLNLNTTATEKAISRKVIRQDTDWHQRMWAALKNAGYETAKNAVGLGLTAAGIPGAAIAAAIVNVIIEGTRGALEDDGILTTDAPQLPFEDASNI